MILITYWLSKKGGGVSISQHRCYNLGQIPFNFPEVGRLQTFDFLYVSVCHMCVFIYCLLLGNCLVRLEKVFELFCNFPGLIKIIGGVSSYIEECII